MSIPSMKPTRRSIGTIHKRSLIILIVMASQALGFQPLMSRQSSGIPQSLMDTANTATISVPLGTQRRSFLVTIGFMPFLTLSDSATATTGSIKTSQYTGKPGLSSKSSISPQVAFDRLIKAREELLRAEKFFLSKRDYSGLRNYLLNEAENINSFEGNAMAILASKRLDDEDKKAIGTIRRYGAGADVIIMYGGLLTEIDESNDEPDYTTAQKYLTRTIESLEEVIAICRNGGFGT